MSLPTGAIVHTCRDYERIRKWGMEHALSEDEWDPTVKADVRGKGSTRNLKGGKKSEHGH
jgi:hypothetical protein